MNLYETKVETPSPLKEIIEAVRGVGNLIHVDETYMIIEIEAEDEYVLAQSVMELENALSTWTMGTAVIPRPTKVEPQNAD